LDSAFQTERLLGVSTFDCAFILVFLSPGRRNAPALC
jgi:hypothetical protein